MYTVLTKKKMMLRFCVVCVGKKNSSNWIKSHSSRLRHLMNRFFLATVTICLFCYRYFGQTRWYWATFFWFQTNINMVFNATIWLRINNIQTKVWHIFDMIRSYKLQKTFEARINYVLMFEIVYRPKQIEDQSVINHRILSGNLSLICMSCAHISRIFSIDFRFWLWFY